MRGTDDRGAPGYDVSGYVESLNWAELAGLSFAYVFLFVPMTVGALLGVYAAVTAGSVVGGLLAGLFAFGRLLGHGIAITTAVVVVRDRTD